MRPIRRAMDRLHAGGDVIARQPWRILRAHQLQVLDPVRRDFDSSRRRSLEGVEHHGRLHDRRWRAPPARSGRRGRRPMISSSSLVGEARDASLTRRPAGVRARTALRSGIRARRRRMSWPSRRARCLRRRSRSPVRNPSPAAAAIASAGTFRLRRRRPSRRPRASARIEALSPRAANCPIPLSASSRRHRPQPVMPSAATSASVSSRAASRSGPSAGRRRGRPCRWHARAAARSAPCQGRFDPPTRRVGRASFDARLPAGRRRRPRPSAHRGCRTAAPASRRVPHPADAGHPRRTAARASRDRAATRRVGGAGRPPQPRPARPRSRVRHPASPRAATGPCPPGAGGSRAGRAPLPCGPASTHAARRARQRPRPPRGIRAEITRPSTMPIASARSRPRVRGRATTWPITTRSARGGLIGPG